MTAAGRALTIAWRWPATWHRGWARGVATVSGILATGFAGLVIEDVFPNPASGAQIGVHTTGLRIILLAAMVLLFGWVFWSGSWRDRTQGTLIYPLFLSRGHVDRHSESAASTGRDRPVFRSLFRRCPVPSSGSADVTEQTEEFSDRLAELIHADDPNTRTTLAPNMLLPIGLVTGWRLTPPSGLKFMEIDSRVEFSVKDLARAWTAPAAGTTASVQDSGAASNGHLPPPSNDSGPIRLDIYLSDKAYDRQEDMPGFPAPAARRVIGVPLPGDPDKFAVVLSGGTTPGAVDPAEVAVLITRAIQQEVAKKRVVILTGRMPKSVSMAVGWLLWQHRGEVPNSQDAPLWRYLVPLVWFDSDQQYRYLRVSYDQPSAVDLGIDGS